MVFIGIFHIIENIYKLVQNVYLHSYIHTYLYIIICVDFKSTKFNGYEALSWKPYVIIKRSIFKQICPF